MDLFWNVDANAPITGTLMVDNRQKIKLESSKWMIWRLYNIKFFSIKGAGHMVLHDEPAAAYII